MIVKGKNPAAEQAANPAAAFPQRLRELVGTSSIRGFARTAGVSDTFLRQCLAGRTEPTRTKLIRLAAAGGCSLEWLATGRESASSGPGPDADREAADRFDAELLQSIVEATEEVLAEHGHSLSPRRKAALFVALYDRYRGNRQFEVSPDDILQLVSRPS